MKTSALAVLIAAIFVFLAAGTDPVLVDDAFITMQYAKTLAETGVPTWHPELPLVDGYTSLLHMIVMSLGHMAGVDLILWGSVINLSSALLILATFFWLARDRTTLGKAIGLLVVSANVSFLFWIGAGLDALLYMAIFLVAYGLYDRAIASHRFSGWLALALLALSMARPEGMFIALALIIFYWATQLGWPTTSLVRSAFWTGSVVAAVAGIILWRADTYGFPLPNTYYAKMSSTRYLEILSGYHHARSWIMASFGGLVLMSVVAFALRSGNWLRLLFVAGLISTVVLAGGDPHPAYRFFLPALPLMALDVAWLVDRFRSSLVRVSVAVVALVLTLKSDIGVNGFFLPNPVLGIERTISGDWPMTSSNMSARTERQAIASRELRDLVGENTPVAGTDVGALAYFSELPILDALGLNHPEISHLPKPSSRGNQWGEFRLDYLIARDVPFIYLRFPDLDDWSFDGVAQGRHQCTGRARNVALMTEVFYEEIAAYYLCVSAHSEADDSKRINLLVRKGHAEILDGLANQVQVTSCLRDFRAACGTSQ